MFFSIGIVCALVKQIKYYYISKIISIFSLVHYCYLKHIIRLFNLVREWPSIQPSSRVNGPKACQHTPPAGHNLSRCEMARDHRSMVHRAERPRPSPPLTPPSFSRPEPSLGLSCPPCPLSLIGDMLLQFLCFFLSHLLSECTQSLGISFL